MIQSKSLRIHLPVLLYALFILVLTSYPKLETPGFDLGWEDKIYHFGAYFIFGLLLARSTTECKLEKLSSGIFKASIIGIIFSIFDELHQIAIPGRYAEFYDGLADITGILTAQLAFFVLINFIQKNKMTKNPKGTYNYHVK